MENLDVVSAVDFYLEKAFYLFGFIMLGMAWLTFFVLVQLISILKC